MIDCPRLGDDPDSIDNRWTRSGRRADDTDALRDAYGEHTMYMHETAPVALPGAVLGMRRPKMWPTSSSRSAPVTSGP